MKGMGHTGDQVQGRRTAEFGNPIQQTGGGFPTDTGAAVGYGGADTTGAFLADIGGTTGHGPDMGTEYVGSGTQGKQHHGVGITDKIKEKLTGGHKDEQKTSTTTAGAYEREHEKKG